MKAPAKPAKAAQQFRQASCLADAVRIAVEDYLDHLGDEPPRDLHAKVLDEVERPLLQAAMAKAADNQSHAATMLGISRSTLRKKLLRYQLL
ncbi:MAG: Fis family transcriptional regulator [Cellvibrionales bacterium]|nr:Fis family transcriptional regulator [Cellvibrionales bacterium]